MKPHLCHVFPAFAHGGPEVRTAMLINASADHFRHTVVSITGELSGRSRIEAADVRFLEAPRTGRGSHVLALSRLLRTEKPNLVLTYGWGGTDALLAARLSGFCRVLHTEDGFLPDEAQGQKWKRVLVRRVLLRLARMVICPSRNLERIARQIWWLPTSKILYLPNGIDTHRFVPGRADALRERLGFEPDEIIIGTVGHLRAEKNQARLIDAFATLPSGTRAKLLLLGDGPLREDLATQVDRLGLRDRVVFTGIIKDPAEYYQAMDVFALSSDTEQMPIALLEAMASGLPVVSTAVGDVRDMVCDLNRSRVVVLGQNEPFATALRDLVECVELRQQLGQANRQRCVEAFDQSDMVAAYLRLYETCLGKQDVSERQTDPTIV